MKCRKCNGYGEYRLKKDDGSGHTIVKCFDCGGKGKISPKQYAERTSQEIRISERYGTDNPTIIGTKLSDKEE